MEALHKQHCEVSRVGSPLISNEDAPRLLVEIPGWRKEFHEGVEKLIKEFDFVEFKDGFDFSFKLAAIADEEQHHPAILNEWGKVTVYWWTHAVNGLHMNDFIMAAKTDVIAKSVRQGGNL